MKNYAQYSDEAQNPDKYLTENAVRPSIGWDIDDEDIIAEQFTAVVMLGALAALYVLMF